MSFSVENVLSNSSFLMTLSRSTFQRFRLSDRSRDGQSVLRSLIGPDRSLGNFWKSNKAVLPIFCSTTELIKDQKVAGNIPSNIDVETKKIGLELILGYLLAEIAELRKENAEIPELREKLLKFAEVEAENAKLKQIIEENARRDSENAELKSRVRELEARLSLLGFSCGWDGVVIWSDTK
ncbi:unnamed protein product [Rhizophagus irregularis]|nr:unnamed protein product [Rhizophagus irregularis]